MKVRTILVFLKVAGKAKTRYCVLYFPFWLCLLRQEIMPFSVFDLLKFLLYLKLGNF